MRYLRSTSFAAIVGVALFAGAPAHSTLQIVTQSSLTFSPPSVNIVEGDTVRWVWSSLSHTVTNGTGALDPAAGSLFDAPLSSVAPTFEYVFTTAGSYPYFCRPHEGFNMKGTVVVDVPTSVRAPGAVEAALHPNLPNPFGAKTEIAFDLSAASHVALRVYDAGGRLVATLLEDDRSEGKHRASWNGRDAGDKPLPSGVYFCRLETATGALTRKLVLIR